MPGALLSRLPATIRYRQFHFCICPKNSPGRGLIGSRVTKQGTSQFSAVAIASREPGEYSSPNTITQVQISILDLVRGEYWGLECSLAPYISANSGRGPSSVRKPRGIQPPVAIPAAFAA